VCFIGRDADVTDAAKATIRALYDEACRLSGRTLRYSGHGQLPGQNTSCPGDNLRAWVGAGMPYPTNRKDDNMQRTARDPLTGQDWIGDGIFRRAVSPAERDGWNAVGVPHDGDTTNVNTYGRDIAELEMADPAEVDVAALAAALAPLLPKAPTAAEVATAVADEDHKRSAA
jgi:hypothetical protein